MTPAREILGSAFLSDAQSHTGRELELMLSGRKPLAMFYAESLELPSEEIVPEDAFAPYVQTGLILRKDIELTDTAPSGITTNLKYVFYALPGQEWRIQMMIVLKRALYASGGWSEPCERIEGTLLGYTDDENDIHCARKFKRSAS